MSSNVREGTHAGVHTPRPILKLRRCKAKVLRCFSPRCAGVTPPTPDQRPVSGRNGGTHGEPYHGSACVVEWWGSTWATTGKQCWRCGVIRERGYGARVLAHLQNPQRMSPARDSRTVVMKAGIR